MDGQLTLSNAKGEPVHSTLYRQVIGCLMYLAVGTRPDISFPAGRLAQFVETPTKDLWVCNEDSPLYFRDNG